MAAGVALLAAAAPALADSKGDAKSQVEFGINVAQRGLWREAIYRWEKAVELDPTYAAAYNDLAIAYEHEGQLDKARKAYEKAIELSPNNEPIRQNYELFQGFSAGGRVEVMKQVFVSTNLGRSSRTGDATSSLNEMFGLTYGRLPWVHLRADAHYARFNSSFGSGSYEAFSLSKQFSDNLRLEMLAGQQNFTSAVTTNSRGRFLTGTVETTLGPHYYLQGSFTTNRGQLSYDQFMFSLGYRFDSKKHKE